MGRDAQSLEPQLLCVISRALPVLLSPMTHLRQHIWGWIRGEHTYGPDSKGDGSAEIVNSDSSGTYLHPVPTKGSNHIVIYFDTLLRFEIRSFTCASYYDNFC